MITLGLDIGTTTISTIAFDTSASRLLASSTVQTDAEATPPAQRAAGWAEIDMHRVYHHALDAMQNCMAQLAGHAREVSAIGVTGQMHGVAFLNAKFEPARTAITWQDQRGHGLLPDFTALAGGAGAFEKLGALPAAGYGGVTLFWLRDQDLLPNATLSSIPDAIGAMLCHATPKMNATHAAGWGMFDLERQQWDEGLLARLRLDAHLPEIKEAGKAIGITTVATTSHMGLPASVPVTVALGDHQASLIGSGCTQAGMAHVNIGTGGQVSLISDRFVPINVQAGIETRPFIQGQFVLTGASLCGGSAFALLRRFYEDAALMMGMPMPDEASLYQAMLASASAVPAGADGMIADTRFDGARHDPQARASLNGLRRYNFTPAHLNRAVLEGIAGELGDFYDAMTTGQTSASTLIGSGNALRKNELLREMVSRRFGLPLQMPAWQEEAAVGAAMMAERG